MKIVYETQWIAKDNQKEYPHGWGFTAPLVEFPQKADPAWCAEICRQKLSNEEFECIGATPRKLIDDILFDYPTNEVEYKTWKEKNKALAES